MIAEDYVSFETAKLLKEKGFNGECSCYYFFKDKAQFEESLTHWNWNNGYPFRYSAPTLQMTMKWLREVHHIIIVPQPLSFNNAKDCLCENWVYSLWVGYKLEVDESLRNQTNHPTYEEAAEAAIKYCLEKLI